MKKIDLIFGWVLWIIATVYLALCIFKGFDIDAMVNITFLLVMEIYRRVVLK